ncbi:unnamed protein product [Sympodiomycopsis kandeliae]
MAATKDTTEQLRGDASFGLDPSADVDHHLEGHRWVPRVQDVAASLNHLTDGILHDPHHHNQPHQADNAHAYSSKRGAHEQGRSPTRKDESIRSPPNHAPVTANDHTGKPNEAGTSPESDSSDQRPFHPPTGSLTLAFFAPGISLPRRLSLLGSSLFINLMLPFVNGTMLGIGEILARGLVLPLAGIGLGLARRYFRGHDAG